MSFKGHQYDKVLCQKFNILVTESDKLKEKEK